MSVPDPDPLIGARLGRYEVLGRLGEGGMGVVYRARDTELEREVALKVLPPDALADAELRATLLHEARTASQLNHPNVCTIHEVGQDGGRIYVAMELVQGRPLRELIPPGGLPDETVVRYAAPLARALAHAHERRVVHRDLKTANVVIGPGGQPKLLDFGLSRRILDETSRGAPAMATSGGVAGTPQYLAPEILMGGRAGASSDLWALGVVLYELCSGTVPFSGGPLGSVVTAILHATPAPLPDHTGPGLRAVTMRCLAKEPSQRYSSAAEAAAALEALLPGSLATGGSPRSRYRLRWPPRRRVVFALGASAMALVAVGISLPNSPGLVGQFQWFTLLGLSLYLGPDVLKEGTSLHPLALAAAITQHLMQVIWYVAMGFLGIATPWVSFADMRKARANEPPPETGPQSAQA